MNKCKLTEKLPNDYRNGIPKKPVNPENLGQGYSASKIVPP
jgi:hypothetical protein